MNRQELIDAIAEDTEASKASVARFLDSFIGQVQNTVAGGGEVKLTGFGKFERAKVAARPGRNPLTGEKLVIPEGVRPRFTPGAGFKEVVKG
ncbi:HU family DNA-binding protein [Ideonella sp. B508-1]|uniref:HU family DNA-binding protein n=1 Tax=Ideonella sp. B508-1 TaxID=137716 RepID=UPI00034849F8|nr:HU family DNA-binding protein [Ideonella sp. B508-1]